MWWMPAYLGVTSLKQQQQKKTTICYTRIIIDPSAGWLVKFTKKIRRGDATLHTNTENGDAGRWTESGGMDG